MYPSTRRPSYAHHCQSDMILRTDISRVNDQPLITKPTHYRFSCPFLVNPEHPSVLERRDALQSTFPGGELMASVISSRAARIPTHQAIIEDNAKVALLIIARRLRPSRRVDSRGRNTDRILRTRFSVCLANASAADTNSNPTVRM